MKKETQYCNCLYYSANALSRIMTKMADKEFAVIGLSSSYAFLLMAVNEKPGIQPKELSCKMQLTPSTITRLIEKMEYRGYVKRTHVGRTTEVYPTELSLEMQPKIKGAWASLYNRYSNILGKENAKELTNSIHESAKKLE